MNVVEEREHMCICLYTIWKRANESEPRMSQTYAMHMKFERKKKTNPINDL